MPPKKRKPRMGPPEKFTPAEVIAALEASAGLRSGAARTLKCATSTISNYVERYTEVAAALDEILEHCLDVAEGVLLKRMGDDSNPSQQVSSAQFFLKHKGGARGYGDRQRTISVELPPANTLADVVAAHGAIFEHEERLAAVERHLQQLGIGQARH